MKVINISNNAVLADKARVANTFWKRLIGLLDCKSLQEGEALILKPSNSIHTLFMRFAIDVLFLDKKGKIIVMLSSFKPFRFSPIYFKSILVIELPSGVIKKSMTKTGNIIRIIE